MPLDLNTNGASLRQIIETLVSGKLSWVVFAYTGNTHTLKIEESGDDLDEMADEFIGSKIMYGYCRIIDSNTNLPKFVFINWQGAGAPEQSKFTCSQHVQDIQRFCKTIHVTINARSEDDLDMQEIKDKVSKASGSNYSFHKEKPTHVHLPTKVGSVYERVDPAAELAKQNRESYWSKDQADESNRKAQDKLRMQKEASKTEADIRSRDLGETAAREKADIERSRVLAKQRSFEKSCEGNKPVDVSVDNLAETEAERRHQRESARKEREAEIASLTKERRNSNTSSNIERVGTNYSKVDPSKEIAKARSADPSDDSSAGKVGSVYKKVDPMAELRNARNQSDQDSSGPVKVGSSYHRVDPMAEIKAARSRGDSQNTAASTTTGANYSKVDPMAEIKAARLKAAQDPDNDPSPAASSYKKANPRADIENARRISTNNENMEDTRRTSTNNDNMEDTSAGYDSYDKPSAAEEISNAARLRREEEAREMEEERRQIREKRESDIALERQLSQEANLKFRQVSEHEPEMFDEPQMQHQNVTDNIVATALYDYEATEEDELSFDPGERIDNIEMVDEGWWVGSNTKGQRGLFPANYVEVID